MSKFEFVRPSVPVRLARRLLHGVLLPGSMPRDVRRNGVIMRLTAMNPQERLLLKRGFIERLQFPRFCEGVVAFSPTVLLDIGANLGYYSLHAAHFGLCDTIHAVECSPRFFSRLYAQHRSQRIGVAHPCGLRRCERHNAQSPH